MRLIFIHQNFPGQWKSLAEYYGADSSNDVKFITQRSERRIPGVQKVLYDLHRKPHGKTHQYVQNLEKGVLFGQGVARALLSLKRAGFRPDVIIGHSGWGETLFVKDIFPNVPLLVYSEFYYNSEGADVGFDSEFQRHSLDDGLRLRVRNASLTLSLVACDWVLTPTQWQWQQHPDIFRSKMSVIHEGIDCQLVAPCDEACFELTGGRVLTRKDEVITYVARNLEPYRGFHMFMRALPRLLKRRPNVQVLIVGGDEVSYGQQLRDGRTYRQMMLSEVGSQEGFDPGRVNFLGRLPYNRFLKMLQISSVHVYLTYPFVLSWSMLEAMAVGCVVVGSATPPVKEVISDGENGLLVDFFDPERIADRVEEVLEHPDQMAGLRNNARQTIMDRYDLRRLCMPELIRLVTNLAGGQKPGSS